MLAPIALFVYNRPDHTRRTVESLVRNRLANESPLIIYSDAPKSEAQTGKVREVREYVRQVRGFKSVTVIERESNLGLARSIIDGVSATVKNYGRVIVLEDDMVTSPYFLTYMNEGLDRFADDDWVVSIHGYVYPVAARLPEAFFLRGADCWGWATWQRGWACFNPDGQSLLNELGRRGLIHSFDCNGTYPFSKMLKEQIEGKNDSWAVRWHASAFLADKLTLYPGRSLVHNIGNDSSGTHCGTTDQHDALLSMTPIGLGGIEVRPSDAGRLAFEDYFRSGRRTLAQRAIGRLVRFLKVKTR